MKFDWLPVTRFEQNCSILWCEATRKAAVIDPGGDIDQLCDFLQWDELELEVVLVTHGHFDHAGGAAALAAATGARIEGPHQGDEHLIRGLDAQGARFNVRAQSYTPARWLSDGDEIRFGEEVLQVLHCPGHAPGHVVFFNRAAKFAHVGDVLFNGSVGRTDLPGGNHATLIASIRNKLLPLGDDVGFICGHGPGGRFGEERRSNPFLVGK